MAGGLVAVDDAGHFGGNMDEQFTAAIDAMADELPPHIETCPPATGQGDARAGAGSSIGAPVFTRSGRRAAAGAGRGATGPRYGPKRSGCTLAGGAVGVDAVCCDSPRTDTWSATD
jgi:hypothetical protein